MKDFTQINDEEFVFGGLLIVANKMDTLLERTLKKHGITSKQWFLMLVMLNIFKKPPTLKEVAKEMGTTHQNVKQIALKLEIKEMLRLEKDNKDSRVTRILLTDKSCKLWNIIESDGIKFINSFYKNIDKKNLNTTRKFILQVLTNLNSMEEGDE